MITVEETLIDEITATFHYLRTGKISPPIPIPEGLPENEIRQLITYVNRFLIEFAALSKAMAEISQGNLDTEPAMGKMSAAQSFRALQSNLKHLTYKTQQIAAGDLEQKVDFMGNFSIAFNSMTQQLKDSYEQLELRNRFIRQTFGRYTSDQIVEALLDMPDGLKLGGEKREVTLLMSDLRGFTALAERLEATDVVLLLNHYLSVMVDVIQKNSGTIDEIIGDAIFVLFGAPVKMEDDPRKAIRCALEMQKAMSSVNEDNIKKGWPVIEMGIALHTGEVVVGNIGSTKRSKYGVVGRNVNLTARIESFTVGGQILVSPTLMTACQEGLILGDEIEVHAKGMAEGLKCRELLGHEAFPELRREEVEEIFVTLTEPLPFHYLQLTGKHLNEQMQQAKLVALSDRQAIVEVLSPLAPYVNIMLRFAVEARNHSTSDSYAKVIHPQEGSSLRYVIHFTSLTPEVRAWLQGIADREKNQLGGSRYSETGSVDILERG